MTSHLGYSQNNQVWIWKILYSSCLVTGTFYHYKAAAYQDIKIITCSFMYLYANISVYSETSQ